MKKIIYLLVLSAPAFALAQQKIVTQATITTKTTIVAPDDDEGGAQQTIGGGEEMRVMRFGGDGETKSTTYVKNDLVKTFSESEMGRNTVIRDNSKKITTTIMEMMGRKSGFYASDEDQENMRKQIDSMMQSRGGQNRMAGNSGPVTTEVVELNETKKISGYECRKALLISKRSNGRADTTTVWYTPEFKIQGVSSTGGFGGGGFGGFTTQSQSSSGAMDKLNGFPLQYERNMGRGRKMTVQVTKIVIDKEIADKEFELPKDIEIKAMKDMQNGMPGSGRVEFRMGGN